MRSFRVALAALLLPLTCVVAYAALPTFWQTSTEADFLKGEFENLSLDSYGRLTLGPSAATVYESSAPFLWTLLTAADGTAYVGTGNDGQVYKIDSAGKTAVFFDAEELEVHALAAAPNGGLFVATSPDGKIYRVDATGKGTVFFDPPDKYIWSLVTDRNGNLFAATGDKGVIYKIPADGKGTVFYQTKATHAMTLALDQQGRLLAGTQSPGRVFQIDAAGKPFVLLDSGYNEIHQIRVRADGSIFAAAVRGRAGNAASSSSSDNDSSAGGGDAAGSVTVSVSTEVTAVAVADTSGGTTTGGRVPVGPGAGAVFRIAPDGGSETLWDSQEDTPYDIAFAGDHDILVATGNHGKIYRLSGERYEPTLVTRANAEQVTTLATDRSNRTLYATSNPGKVFRLGADRADRGTYTSDVHDGQTVSTWGVVKWGASTPAGTRVELSTRSGNTRTPDETWSDWSNAYNTADGTQITSPRARYLQWRAVLIGSRGNAPLLSSVTAAYLPRNLRPRVTGITIQPPGTVFQRQFPVDPEIAGFEGDTPDRRALARVQSQSGASSTSLGRRTYEKGLLTFVWHADDENHDTLTYQVEYRREGETEWKPLKLALSDTILVWDTTSVPDGRYVIRVVASDAPSNSATTALTGSLESATFDVDNTPPMITVGQVRRDGNRMVVTFDVKDGESSVQKAEYSLDGDRWVTIYPRDGIADSKSEQFELTLDTEAAGRAIIVRANDALNNVASKDVAIPASGRR